VITAITWSLEHRQVRTYGALGFTFSVLYQYRLGNINALRVFATLLSSQRQRRVQHGCSCSIALRLAFCMYMKPQLSRLKPRAMPSPDQENNTARSAQLAHLGTLFYHRDI
jgi:hypothetical protein